MYMIGINPAYSAPAYLDGGSTHGQLYTFRIRLSLFVQLSIFANGTRCHRAGRCMRAASLRGGGARAATPRRAGAAAWRTSRCGSTRARCRVCTTLVRWAHESPLVDSHFLHLMNKGSFRLHSCCSLP